MCAVLVQPHLLQCWSDLQLTCAEVKAASARYTKLRESFRERFHAQPDLFTRAPGTCMGLSCSPLSSADLRLACVSRPRQPDRRAHRL